MFFKFNIKTNSRCDFIDVTHELKRVVQESGVESGMMVVFIPHTTAAVTINENADPDVKRDMEINLSNLVPESGDYKHYEGNSDAHIKASLMGFSETLIIDNGDLVLGTWQGIYFSEFDGPRNRKIYVKIIS